MDSTLTKHDINYVHSQALFALKHEDFHREGIHIRHLVTWRCHDWANELLYLITETNVSIIVSELWIDYIPIIQLCQPAMINHQFHGK